MKTLDIAAVKAFVLTAELQSFTRAAEALDVTQSAVSLKLRRLEEQLGRRLLERTPRQVRLSADGVGFLDAARALIATHDRAVTSFDVAPRRLVVGVSHQLAGGELPSQLRRIRDRDPHVRIELRIAGTRELMHAHERGDLDAALVLRPEQGHKRGKVVFAERFSWFAARGWTPPGGQPLPLATQGPQCRVRCAAVHALDKAGLRWEEVFVGQGAAVVGAAATAGFAMAVISEHAAPSGTEDIGFALALPPIPAQDVVLYSSLTDRRSREALHALTLAFHAPRRAES